MGLGHSLGSLARRFDRRFGIIAWLSGEPRPPAGGFDLQGEKLLDWGWLCANLPYGPKRALEIGPGCSPVIPAMLALGYEVVAVDFESELSRWIAGFKFLRGDFMKVALDPEFDVIVACSVLEHVGLAGRYGSAEDPDGDLGAMRKIASLLADDGSLLLTVPVGKDAVFRPFHRVYGKERLPKLLDGFLVTRSRFLVKEPWGPWHESSQAVALDYPRTIKRYALGEFILRKTSRRTEASAGRPTNVELFDDR